MTTIKIEDALKLAEQAMENELCEHGNAGRYESRVLLQDMLTHFAALLSAHQAEQPQPAEHVRNQALKDAAAECEHLARQLNLHGAQRCADAIRLMIAAPAQQENK